MRTRSHPVSPGGLVSLDDVPARRRRNTRSVSAQPQDAEPGSGADEASKPKPTPKPRRGRAKSTRGKKVREEEGKRVMTRLMMCLGPEDQPPSHQICRTGAEGRGRHRR
jgi:hypothetical protein